MPAQYRQATLDYLQQSGLASAAQRQSIVDVGDAGFDVLVTSIWAANAAVMAVSAGLAIPANEVSSVNVGNGIVDNIVNPL